MVTLTGNIKFNNADVFTSIHTDFLKDTFIKTIDCIFDNKSLELKLEYDFCGNFIRGNASKYINNILVNSSIWYPDRVEQIGFFKTLDDFWLSFLKHVFSICVPAW